MAGCGQSGPSPIDIVQSYVGAIAEGNFSSACGMLDRRARQSLSTSLGSSGSCASLLARCFPNQATNLARDQTQLLYGTVQLAFHGRDMVDAQTGGTAVAKRIREVTLANERAGWVLTSYGRERCERQARKARPARTRRRRHGPS